jgi:hypothetical protein
MDRKLMLLPQLVKSSTESELPSCESPYTERLLPNLPKERNDIADPMWK